VAQAFLDGIGRGSGAARVMTLQWRAAGLLRVERRVPLTTASGKILHLHQERRPVPTPQGWSRPRVLSGLPRSHR
jgi:hypothetical protein